MLENLLRGDLELTRRTFLEAGGMLSLVKILSPLGFLLKPLNAYAQDDSQIVYKSRQPVNLNYVSRNLLFNGKRRASTLIDILGEVYKEANSIEMSITANEFYKKNWKDSDEKRMNPLFLHPKIHSVGLLVLHPSEVQISKIEQSAYFPIEKKWSQLIPYSENEKAQKIIDFELKTLSKLLTPFVEPYLKNIPEKQQEQLKEQLKDFGVALMEYIRTQDEERVKELLRLGEEYQVDRIEDFSQPGFESDKLLKWPAIARPTSKRKIKLTFDSDSEQGIFLFARPKFGDPGYPASGMGNGIGYGELEKAVIIPARFSGGSVPSRDKAFYELKKEDIREINLEGLYVDWGEGYSRKADNSESTLSIDSNLGRGSDRDWLEIHHILIDAGSKERMRELFERNEADKIIRDTKRLFQKRNIGVFYSTQQPFVSVIVLGYTDQTGHFTPENRFEYELKEGEDSDLIRPAYNKMIENYLKRTKMKPYYEEPSRKSKKEEWLRAVWDKEY